MSGAEDSGRLVLGPFNRVEGDLEVRLEVSAGRVAAAYVNSPLFRGFETILQGKDPLDAMVLVPRICGICSVSQSAAAAAALAEVMGIAPPPNGRLAANLTLAAENLADHLSHFYLFFMPDFARDAYAAAPWFGPVAERFKAIHGSAAGEALPARAELLQLMGVLAGKWPHTLSLQPGGSSRAVGSAEATRLYLLLRGFRRWLERRFFGDSLEAFAGLDSLDALWAWSERGEGDLRSFLRLGRDLGLERVGHGADLFISCGAYAQGPDAWLFPRGVWSQAEGRVLALDHTQVAEDASHAWMAGDGARHPYSGITEVFEERTDAYSWCKAPRWRGQVVECGALARQLVAGQALLRSLVARHGGSVLARVLARAIEFARVLPAMETWVQALVPGEPFCMQGRMPDEGRAVGMVEAARGSLGHWLVVRHGRIANYQIVAPTTWNFAPRDAAGVPGALEQALVGLSIEDAPGAMPLQVQHVVRSFDPCMVCTVH